MATANQKVGSVYAVGLEGVGYMLAESPAKPVRRQTGVLDVQPPGSDDPLSERIGRYDFVGMSDWTGGEGQEMASRPSSDSTRYWYSEWLAVFTPGQISCLRELTQEIATTDSISTDTNPMCVVADDNLYVITSATGLTHVDEPGGTETAFSTGLGGADIDGFASDGEYWYASDGVTIRRNNTAADPAADWSTEDVTEIAWCTDRLMGIDNVASPSELVSFSPTGTGTVLAATHGVGFTLRGLCGGDGYVWYGANRAGQGHVRYWQVDSSPINTGVALTVPEGETVDSLFYYLGNVFMATLYTVLGSDRRKIYRCVPSDGLLTPQVVVDGRLQGQIFAPLRTWFAGIDRFVAFTWPTMMADGQTGYGLIDLETGGYSRHRGAAGTTAGIGRNPRGLAAWNDVIGMAVTSAIDGGFYSYGSANTIQVAYLETSIDDLATPALKHLDEILVSSDPLTTGESIAVAYSVDNGATFTTLATFDTVGDSQHSATLTTAVSAPSYRLRITLTPNGSTSTPVVNSILAKTHVTGIVDEIIELPVNCEDYVADVSGTNIAEDSGPGKGMARYRALQALIGTKVLFQDVDWKTTQETCLCEVVGVESTSVQLFNQARNLSDVASHVAVVTLRSPYAA